MTSVVSSSTAKRNVAPRPMIPSSAEPRAAGAALGPVKTMALGDESSCWLSPSSSVLCAGWIFEDKRATKGPRAFRAAHAMGITDAKALALGWGVGCAVHADGDVSCWGLYGRYVLGRGDENHGIRQLGDLHDVAQLTLGLGHLCALGTNGRVSCWGSPDHGVETGEAGDDITRPSAIQGLDDIVEIAAGSFHTCALSKSGTVRCFGLGDHFELGDGAGKSSARPVEVAGLGDVVQIAANHFHTCALKKDKTVWCWGEESHVELGDTMRDAPEPHQLKRPTQVTAYRGAEQIAVGFDHTCARFADGTVQCAGSNALCQLGRKGTNDDPRAAAKVAGLEHVIALTAHRNGNCAMVEGGTVRCWGYNTYGALATGDEDVVCTPTEPRVEAP